MGLLKRFLNQCRKPEGILGKIMLKGMNVEHAKVADWGLARLESLGMAPSDVLDIGCGGGRNVGELLKRYPLARVAAIDHSPLSVEKTKEYNKDMIDAGRCSVQEGDVSALPFDTGSFDIATAFETVYFWPGLEECFAEAARVLRPGGCFMIVNELDGENAWGHRFARIIDGMKNYSLDEIEAALRAAGFPNVTTDRHPSKSWIAVLARK